METGKERNPLEIIPEREFQIFSREMTGEFYYSDEPGHLAIRKVYATDASMYQEIPLAVLIPASVHDIQKAILFAKRNKITLIPRAAGTSLAGQVVGQGMVVDISKHFNRILEINAEDKWVRAEPGVIRDDLNAFLKPYGLLFGPETSTSSRAMIGGMIGNNSCGLHSIIWGSTRDNLISMKVLLSNGKEVEFKNRNASAQDKEDFRDDLEMKIYNGLTNMLRDPGNRDLIRNNFPRAEVKRRNSGYALDSLLEGMEKPIPELDICKLIAGSEGTLCFVTEVKLKIIPLPPPEVVMVAIHCSSIHESLLANLVAIAHQCSASELVDDYILGFAESKGRADESGFKIEGKTKAVLMVEFFANTRDGAKKKADALIGELQAKKIGYSFQVLHNRDTLSAWNVRKSGLGLIRNLPGDSQPVNLIEDCAVAPEDLPDFIREVLSLLEKFNLKYCIYAHAGAGELHVEPVLNLKTTAGRLLLRKILEETTAIVKKYRGSLSGEHGDGRLRGEMIPFMMGTRVYDLFREVKSLFDPDGIFNRSKIIDSLPMDEYLRYAGDSPATQILTYSDFSDQENLLRFSEKCSGSGDCRKSEVTGGVMCPSFMATRSERDTTRARANILRQFITRNGSLNGEGEEEVKEIMDLCLSCKGCKTECPTGVDISRMKAEFMQHYYDRHGIPIRSGMVGSFARQMQMIQPLKSAYNFLFGNKFSRQLLNRLAGFHPQRSIPMISMKTMRQRIRDSGSSGKVPREYPNGVVYLFCDEFSEFLDAETGAKAFLLLQRLGYDVRITIHAESGRAMFSKGMLKKAIPVAERNVKIFSELVNDAVPLVGIEPSAILGFRDEYPKLVSASLRETAIKLAASCFTFEEFISRERKKGKIRPNLFTSDHREIFVHEHCHQKALSSRKAVVDTLSLPVNYVITTIPSGCCGMAGSFGYEEEHYELSMKIGELVLFPFIRNLAENALLAAAGTSCRHQIKDGTSRRAFHPVEILFDALIEETTGS